jgi:hypothetical protein
MRGGHDYIISLFFPVKESKLKAKKYLIVLQ